MAVRTHPDAEPAGPAVPARRGLRRLRHAVAPPAPLAPRSRVVLFVLAVIAVGTSFQGSIPSASLTYAAREWGASTAAQTGALAVIRADVVLSVVLMRLADRIGRRRLLGWTAVVGPLLTAACALSPNLPVFTGLQVVSRAFVTATAILIAVIAVEEVPASSRSWASGLLVIAAALGSGIAVSVVGLADHGLRVWRWFYLLPLVTIAVVPSLGRRLPESERFLRHARREEREEREEPAGPAVGASRRSWRSIVREVNRGAWQHRRRLVPLCVFLALLAFENAPSRQLQNEFLRLERGYSSQGVALFSVLSNAPGIFGLVVGSVLGDRVGHRKLLAGACIGFGVCDAGMFLSHGPAIWVWSIAGALLGAASLPILGVLTAEMFPTSYRSTANSLTVAASRAGGALGLLVVGLLTRTWSRGSSIASTSVMVGLSLLMLPLLPETVGKDLEVLNPEDALDASAGAAQPGERVDRGPQGG